ncbi:MAG TPA: 16S rRNA (guanine(966)-N(2))-methyltransferase RsmD [Candidatus Saccharimonadales bacterium]|nr:16S rRNA (guanine(966)-N(2))-methyltransferase RsmD [Candidatus Saccharimonadales bacterium]
MRVIAGYLKGREFRTPHGHKTHPMSDKARGALFNVLGDIDGLVFLDAFAGSGALAIEAVSRGAKSVTAIDKDSAAHKIIEQNVKDLRIGSQLKAVKANTAGWSIHNMEKKFDIVLLDPPYDDLQINLLGRLIKRHVKKTGLAVLSYPGHAESPDFDNMEVVAAKNYGDAQLVFYRKIS